MCFAPPRPVLFRHTSKSALNSSVLYTFDFEMCFAPQRRALFWHLNFQKWSGPVCTFWLRNVLRATTACNFSSLICPAGSAPAALASLLFDPPEPQIIGKTQCFATFLPFRAPGSSFFWDFPFFDLLSSSLLFADSAHLCFSSVHIVGSLTSKLPSMILYHIISHQQADSNFFFAPSWLFLCLRGLISCCAYICFLECALVLKR